VVVEVRERKLIPVELCDYLDWADDMVVEFGEFFRRYPVFEVQRAADFL
jgi:hypothetical protein